MRTERSELADMLKTAGVAQPDKVIGIVETVMWEALREEFIHCLTVDSETRDVRRKDFNQAIFMPDTGREVFVGTTLGMVLAKYDQAVKNLRGER